jgi:predicted nucleotidyltransferase
MALLEPLFKTLNDAGVRYVVVGGLAVVLQGHARLTADVDLIVDLEPGAAAKAIETLTAMNLRPQIPVNPLDFADSSIRAGWIRDRGMQVFSFVDPSNPMRIVDLFVDHPIPFDDLWSRSEQFELSQTTVRVASIPDLIRLKRLAARPQDLSDIEQLEAIQRIRNSRT